MKKIFSLILFAALVLLSVSSCSRYSDTEISEAMKEAKELIEKSYEINEIFFGKGLPHEESGDGPLDPNAYDEKPVTYNPVVSDKYKDTESLEEAAKEVYTESFLNDSVFKYAFEGQMDGDALNSYAQYIMDIEGRLCVRPFEEKEILNRGRTYDVSTIKFKEEARGIIFFTVESFLDGKSEGEVTFQLVDEGNGWRLNTPTY